MEVQGGREWLATNLLRMNVPLASLVNIEHGILHLATHNGKYENEFLIHNPCLALQVEGRFYSSVCGHVRGYGGSSAFNSAIKLNGNLENNYVDGVSLILGPPGSRTHILTFAAANADGFAGAFSFSELQ